MRRPPVDAPRLGVDQVNLSLIRIEGVIIHEAC
jgi:hypothetical protein